MDFLRRKYTTGEEIFNAVSHGLGVLLSIAGCVLLVVFTAMHNDTLALVSASIYGASLIILYTMSTLYHAITAERAKGVLRVMDHATIYILIGGTYTPYTLSCLRGAWGWTLFGVIWAAAIVGITLSSINLRKFQKASMVCYIAMGWAIIFAIKPLWENTSMFTLVFLIIGGLLYTGGIAFYLMKESKYMHSIWHLFVIAGSIFHYFSIFVALT